MTMATKTMAQLATYCAFKAGWQVYHAGRHEDYPSLIEAAKAGYDAAKKGAVDADQAFDEWRLPAFPRPHRLEARVGRRPE
jgi:hypothetical protein